MQPQHDNNTNSVAQVQRRPFTGFQKSVFIGLVLAALIALLSWQTFGAWEVGVTLTSNDTLEQGLVGHWTFDGENMDWSSTTAEVRDRSGQGNSGNADAMTSQSVMQGVLGQALALDGTDDFFSIPDVDGVTDFSTAQDFSVSTWVKIPPTQNNTDTFDNAIIEKWEGAADGYPYVIRLYNQTNETAADRGKLFTARYDGNTVSALTSTISVNDDTWHHIVFLKRGGSIYLYIDGEQDGTTADNSTFATTNTSPVYFGRRGGAGSLKFTGAVDDVRLYNRALSAEEVKRLYGLGSGALASERLAVRTLPNTVAGLAGYWTLDSRDLNLTAPYWTEIRDSSGNGYHGDWQNAATNTIPGQIGEAIDLTGTTSQERFAFTTFDGSHVAGAFTFAGWARLDFLTEGLNHQLFQYTDGDQSPSLYYDYPDGDLRFRLRGPLLSLTGTTILETTFEPVLGKWYHLTGTFDGTTAAVYVDGELLKSDTVLSGSPATPAGYLRAGPGFGGGLDDLRVYSRALSADEVRALYRFSASTYIATTPTTNLTLETGLVGHWTFDGYDMDWSSTTAEVRDRSGQGNHGNTDASMNANISTAAGVMGQGLAFDGSTYVNIADTNAFSPSTTGVLSVSAWIKAETLVPFNGTTQEPVSKGAGSNYEWSMRIGSTGLASFAVFQADGSNHCVALDSVTFPLNTWVHVVGLYTGSDCLLYVDSVLKSSGNGLTGSITNGTAPMRLGIRGDSSRNFRGALDDVRIYNNILPASEVKRLYQLGQ